MTDRERRENGTRLIIMTVFLLVLSIATTGFVTYIMQSPRDGSTFMRLMWADGGHVMSFRWHDIKKAHAQ